MNGTVDITKTLNPPITYLSVGDSLDLDFAPLAGAITADVGWVRNVDVDPPEPEPGVDIDFPERIKFLVELFRPGSNEAAASKTIAGDARRDLPDLNHRVQPDEAGGTWRCRFTNQGVWDVRFRPRVTFVEQILELEQTALPVRALNHGLSQLVRALELKIHLDRNGSYVDFSEEFKRLANGTITRLNFSLPGLDAVQDVNLSMLDVQVIAPIHTSHGEVQYGPPLIRIHLQFETQGKEVDTVFVDADLESAAVTLHLLMKGDFDSLGRPTGRVGLVPTVQVAAWGHLSGLLPFLVPLTVAGLRDKLQEALDMFLASSVNLRTVGEYLGRGFAQLAGFGHRFYDVASDASNILVTHSPGTRTLPVFNLIQSPMTLEDQLAARQANAAGLANLDKIDCIVVLMQENRSFDHMLGYLRKDRGRNDLEGLTGNEFNAAPGRQPVTVHELGSTTFLLDPAHDHVQVLNQVADGAMSGFLASFIARYPNEPYRPIMGYYAQKHLPAFDLFADEFLLCDRWFCSHPGPTQPNRLSLLIGGRIPQLENFAADSPVLGFLALPTFFDLLTERRVDWVYYEQDLAFLRFLDRYRLDDAHVVPFDDPRDGFFARAARGALPQVTFIEPNFVDIPPAGEANDDHPPADVALGQQMIGCIYNALISSPQWGRILFVITYDEHGGFFDHVPPPGTRRFSMQMTVPPLLANGPAFYGPRVPALVISPWVERGAVDKTVFDHTAIAKTIVLKFLRREGPTVGDPFPTLDSRRFVRAAHLGRLLTRETPRLTVPSVPNIACPPPRRPVRRPPPGMPEPRGDAFHEGVRRFGRPKMLNP